MTEFELLQLELNQQQLEKLNDLNANIIDLQQTVSGNVYESEMTNIHLEELIKQTGHLANQLDLIHHTIWVQSNYLMYMTICLGLLAILIMFLTGFLLTKGR